MTKDSSPSDCGQQAQGLGLSWIPDILGQLSADLDLKTFFTDEEGQEITGLSDGSTDTGRPHLLSDY